MCFHLLLSMSTAYLPLFNFKIFLGNLCWSRYFCRGKQLSIAHRCDLLENYWVILTTLTQAEHYKLNWHLATFCLGQIWQQLSVQDIKAMPVKRQFIKRKKKKQWRKIAEKMKEPISNWGIVASLKLFLIFIFVKPVHLKFNQWTELVIYKNTKYRSIYNCPEIL